MLSELASLRPGWSPTSTLDLGEQAQELPPGWPLLVFPLMCGVFELAEARPHMAALGARLTGGAPPWFAAEAGWTLGDAAEVQTSAPAHPVVAAYVLGELGRDRERPWRSNGGGGPLAVSWSWSSPCTLAGSNAASRKEGARLLGACT